MSPLAELFSTGAGIGSMISVAIIYNGYKKRKENQANNDTFMEKTFHESPLRECLNERERIKQDIKQQRQDHEVMRSDVRSSIQQIGIDISEMMGFTENIKTDVSWIKKIIDSRERIK